MFDLNQQIDHWKRALAAKRTCSRDELEELESHLREEVAALATAGRSEQDAFCEAVSRLGDSSEICSEFAKNERRILCDSLAIRGNSVVVAVVGVAAVVLGLAVWIRQGDGILAAHRGSILFAYLAPFLLAAVGTYAILRTAITKSADTLFRNSFTGQCRLLLGTIALFCAAGAILGGIWTERHWGRFWGWDVKETGAFAVVICAIVLYSLVTRYKPASIHLGQVSLLMSLVTFVAWFGPAVYTEAVGAAFQAVLAVALIVQLSILCISFFLPKRSLAES